MTKEVDEVILYDNEAVFPLGMYDQPNDRAEWQEWKRAGINLLRCHSEEQLDQTHKRKMMGWVPVPIICRDAEGEAALTERVKSLRGHPALVTWEAQDEAIWNACRLDDGVVTNRIWAQPPDVRAMVHSRLDALVPRLRRGSAIVRSLSPGKKVWLNEAAKSDQETLARCLPWLDIVGYDYYPVPEDPWRGRQLHLLGGYTDRFRRTAPSRDVWVVEQAFSWSNISKSDVGRSDRIHDYNSNTWPETPLAESEKHPTVEECRFMAWIAISHGATGLLWFGSSTEKRPSPFLHGLMEVVAELAAVQPFLTAGGVTRIRATPDGRQCPPVLGVSTVARRNGNGILLALINEDYSDHDVKVTGMEEIKPGDLTPVVDPSDDPKSSSDGLTTKMRGHEVRVYVTG